MYVIRAFTDNSFVFASDTKFGTDLRQANIFETKDSAEKYYNNNIEKFNQFEYVAIYEIGFSSYCILKGNFY